MKFIKITIGSLAAIGMFSAAQAQKCQSCKKGEAFQKVSLQDAPDNGPSGKPQRREFKPPQAMIDKYDKDGDGKISKEEMAAAREARMAEMKERRAAFIEKHDTDGDGELSPEERKAAFKGVGGKGVKIVPIGPGKGPQPEAQ